MPEFYFAQIDGEDNVVNILASNEDCEDAGIELDSLKTIFSTDRWAQTYREVEGVRFASIGGKYDSETNSFIDKKPEEYPSFILNNGGWYPPIPKPDKYTEENWPSENGEYTDAHVFYWDEESLSWKIMIFRPDNDI